MTQSAVEWLTQASGHDRALEGEPIAVTDVDDGLATEMSERIYQFNVEATGIGEGGWLGA